MRTRTLVAALLTLIVVLLPHAAAANHLERFIGPGEPRREFPAEFLELLPDDEQQEIALFPKWSDPRIGGWGAGDADARCARGHVKRTPVVFVHGNTEDAWFWRRQDSNDGTIVDVRRRFMEAGYCPNELWGISYTGAPGYATYNDINTDELYSFVQAVRSHLRVRKVDVVAHSLGVTVVRKAAFEHRDLYEQMAAFVAIAGANHGTTSCRGAGEAKLSHVCEEVHPGSGWLTELNSIGETPAGPRYLTIYDGTGTTDTFYLGPDAQSPRLKGACNLELSYVPHNSLARGEEAVEIYLGFLRDGTDPCDGP